MILMPRWDRLDHVSFKLPFSEYTLDLHLDTLVPHVVDAALNSANRQTKLAAAELLHAIVITLIGAGELPYSVGLVSHLTQWGW